MTSLIRRVLGLVFLRLLPLVLITAISWSGYRAAQAVMRQFNERYSVENHGTTFIGTATSLAAVRQAQVVTRDTPTSVPSVTTTHAATSVASDTLVPTSHTPEPTASFSSTPQPSSTPTPSTARSSNTPEPTMTAISPSAIFTLTVTHTRTPQVVAQFNATNTPRPLVLATNTQVSHEAIPTSLPTFSVVPRTVEVSTESLPTQTYTPQPTPFRLPSTNTSVPANTPIAPTPTSEPPTAVATRPLPTPFFPLESEGGRIINGTAVPTIVPLVPREYDLVNIILLGGDDELSEGGYYRTDTMIIVSINRDTHTVSMLSLPRDLFVYIPTTNGAMERLNVVYAFGESIGWTGGGFGLLRQTILYNFGINVHYYARVNFSGFKQIIDTLGGVDIAVDCAYQDYSLIGAEAPSDSVAADEYGLRTLPVGYYTMDGESALWYARTRKISWDFDRGRRQQQLLRAIWQKSLDRISLANAADLWNQGMQMIETDMQLQDFLGLLPIALNLDVSRIRSYTMVRDFHVYPWQPPDGSYVQLPNYENMRRLLEDFYRPPANNQLLVEGATIAVYNGTTHSDWDFVAADRLRWEGFRAVAMGAANNTDYQDTILIDYTGQQKGSSLYAIAAILNVKPENIRIEPDANRVADFGVFVGTNYNSCPGGVLPVEEQ